MHGRLRGKCIYQAELDFHFPTLTMRETLEFSARARNHGSSRENFKPKAEATATHLGLAKTLDTKMGNDLIPGVSGGERKRASIAVRTLADSAPAWLMASRKSWWETATSNAGTTAHAALTAPMHWTLSRLCGTKPRDVNR